MRSAEIISPLHLSWISKSICFYLKNLLSNSSAILLFSSTFLAVVSIRKEYPASEFMSVTTHIDTDGC